MSAQDTYIPRRLDDQWKVGLWDMDVALTWLFIVTAFYSATNSTLGVLVGVASASVITRAMSRLKAERHAGYLLHWVHWHLPDSVMPVDSIPPTHIRRMIG